MNVERPHVARVGFSERGNLCGGDYGDGFEHAHPAGRALFVRGYQAEGTCLVGERRAVHSVCDDDNRVHDAGIEFGQGEDNAVAVVGFGYDVGGHGGATELLSVGNTGFLKQIFEEHTFLGFSLLVARIDYGQSLARHFLEIGHR